MYPLLPNIFNNGLLCFVYLRFLRDEFHISFIKISLNKDAANGLDLDPISSAGFQKLMSDIIKELEIELMCAY